MKLGTIVYDNKIYNLDYMTSIEIEELLGKIEEEKAKNLAKGKEMSKKTT